MAQALDEAKRQRDLTKQSLSQNLDLFESRVREELDWKARLQRDGTRYAVYAAVAVAGLTGALLLRKVVSRSGEEKSPSVRVSSLDDLVAELAALRSAVDKSGKGGSSTLQKLVLRGLGAAASAGAAAAVRQFMESEREPEAAERSRPF